ncbi:MAG: nucleoside kinase [Bacillota bacterium]|nr:nucleoside kinase [Bacillota bacterium]
MDIVKHEGYRTYRQSLLLLLIKAIHELYPNFTMVVHQSVGKSTYCEFKGIKADESMLSAIKNCMKRYVDVDMPFKTISVGKSEAKNIFCKQGDIKKADQLEYYNSNIVKLCDVGDIYTTYYGLLAKSAGELSVFDLTLFGDGFLLRYPNNFSEGKIMPVGASNHLLGTIIEYSKWSKITGVNDVFDLNKMIRDDKEDNVINLSESLHEKKLSKLADIVKESNGEIKVILISGPSSSGKTTFAKRLCLHLKINGLNPDTLSLDDYYKDRGKGPIDENGKPDFEDIEALDISLFNKQLKEITEGKAVETPVYDFSVGTRSSINRTIKLSNDGILIVEGIHALNKRLSELIAERNKLKIYCTPLTVLSFDEYNPISPTDLRLLRRMTRDYQFRNCPAESTLDMWSSVRRGEMKNIFPYEGEADEIFNSALLYEFACLKPKARQLLESVPRDSEYKEKAERILEFLNMFYDMDSYMVPHTSILREFIGESSVK